MSRVLVNSCKERNSELKYVSVQVEGSNEILQVHLFSLNWLIDEAFLTRNHTRGIEFPAQQLLAPRELSTDQRYILKELKDVAVSLGHVTRRGIPEVITTTRYAQPKATQMKHKLEGIVP
jgi:hypothetical protein